MSIAPRKTNLPTPPSPVQGLVAMMEELALVLGHEIELVVSRNTTAHGDLLKRKQKLTIDYRASMKNFLSQQDLVKKLSEKERQQLRLVGQKLAAVTERNAQTLRAAMTATQRLVQHIISIVKREALAAPTYKNPAMAHLQMGGYSPTCKPVAVSRTA